MPLERSTWQLLHDDTRAYTTLAVTLLGAIAAFADALLGEADDISRMLVLGAGLVLCLTIACCVYASGAVFQGLRDDATECVVALRWMHRAVLGLVLGVVLLLAGGWRTATASDPTSAVLAAPLVISDMSGVPSDDLTVVAFSDTGSEVSATVEGPDGETWVVRFDQEGNVVGAEEARP